VSVFLCYACLISTPGDSALYMPLVILLWCSSISFVLQYKPYNYHRKPARRVKNEAECVICMTLIEDTHAGCMMTPCDHIFHADCLQQWMDVKMECPSCRASIP
jgi:hypothetical protein